MKSTRVMIFAAAAIAACCGSVQAQNYPARPIHIFTMEAGGGNDVVTRLIAAAIGPGLGQPIVVENRGGAGGLVAIQAVAKAPPDGYALLSMSGTAWILPLMQDVTYDPLRDLTPISLVAASPGILIVKPDLPAKNIRELIALAKSKPGVLNYSVTSTGSAGHFAAELFKQQAGVDIARIVYKSGAQVMTDLVAGRIDMSFSVIATAMPVIKSGKVRALAVTSAQPTDLAPGVPTIASEGLPGYEQSAGYGFFSPGKTPPAIVNRISQELMKTLRTPDMKERLNKVGADVVAGTPQEFVDFIKTDQVKLGKVIKAAGMTSD